MTEEDIQQRYWSHALQIFIYFSIFILIVVSIYAQYPFYLLYTLVAFIIKSKVFNFLTGRLKSYKTYVFSARVTSTAINFVFIIYYGGPEAPAWLFGVISIAAFNALFTHMAPEFMHGAQAIFRTEGDKHFREIPLNLYSLGITLAMSVHISICSFVMWRNWHNSAVCFVTLVLISFIMNFVAALIREMRQFTLVLIQNKELAKEKRAAMHENEQKTLFIAKMSHELRTPLHAVISCCDMITDTSLSGEQRSFVKIIDKSSKLLLNLIDNILDLSKYEAGHLELESKPYALRDCIETVMSTIKTKDIVSNNALSLSMTPNIPEMVVGDEMRLIQIVSLSLMYH
jgi:signal transduction histidine kinase